MIDAQSDTGSRFGWSLEPDRLDPCASRLHVPDEGPPFFECGDMMGADAGRLNEPSILPSSISAGSFTTNSLRYQRSVH